MVNVVLKIPFEILFSIYNDWVTSEHFVTQPLILILPILNSLKLEFHRCGHIMWEAGASHWVPFWECGSTLLDGNGSGMNIIIKPQSLKSPWVYISWGGGLLALALVLSLILSPRKGNFLGVWKHTTKWRSWNGDSAEVVVMSKLTSSGVFVQIDNYQINFHDVEWGWGCMVWMDVCVIMKAWNAILKAWNIP